MNASDSKERLSAFVDGELRGPEGDRIVDALYEDPELRRTWERFHLIGDAMRGTGPVAGADTVAREVGAALAGESVVRLKPRARRSRLHPLSGLAIAAAIATIAVLGLHHLDGGGVQPRPVADASRAESAGAGPAPAAADRSEVRVASVAESPTGGAASRLQWSGVAPDGEARLNAYLVSHNEYAGDGVRGVLPYVRIVGYQSFEEDGR